MITNAENINSTCSRQFWILFPSCVSTSPTSLLKRFMILPVGVESLQQTSRTSTMSGLQKAAEKQLLLLVSQERDRKPKHVVKQVGVDLGGRSHDNQGPGEGAAEDEEHPAHADRAVDPRVEQLPSRRGFV